MLHETLHRFYGAHTGTDPADVDDLEGTELLNYNLKDTGIMSPETTLTGSDSENELSPLQLRFLQEDDPDV